MQAIDIVITPMHRDMGSFVSEWVFLILSKQDIKTLFFLRTAVHGELLYLILHTSHAIHSS